jgi:hypothetical protein
MPLRAPICLNISATAFREQLACGKAPIKRIDGLRADFFEIKI